MIALSRFFLFGSVYLVMLILSTIASFENEYFAMTTFFITSLCLGGWIYYLHYIAKDPSKGLKEILYVVLFLTIFTTIWACLGIYMQSDFFIYNTDQCSSISGSTLMPYQFLQDQFLFIKSANLILNPKLPMPRSIARMLIMKRCLQKEQSRICVQITL